MPASLEEIFAAIRGEREYQDSKGVATDGQPHSHELEGYVLYMDDYLRELKTQMSRIWGPEAKEQGLHTLRKVVTLGVAAMQEHGVRHRYPPLVGGD